MPLPAELDRKVRARFDELIEEGNVIGSASAVAPESRYTKWSLRANTFLKQFFNLVPGSREVDLITLFERDLTYPINALSGLTHVLSYMDWTNRLKPLVKQ